ncbi:MAG TPA: IclR family transcriptional regulator [Limnochordales bacterium]
MAVARERSRAAADSVPRVQAVRNALQLLALLGQSGPRGMTLAELARALALPKSTVLRIAMTLVDERAVQREEETGLFKLGIRVFEIGSLVLDALEIPRHARPLLERLSQETQETVHLCVLDDGEVVYVDKIESPQRLRLYSRVGKRAPAHCTGVGKVLLAYLPADERRRILERRPLRAYTANTITDYLRFEREMDEVRRTGIAFDREEHEEGVCCAAAPIFDHTGQVRAAVSVTAPAFRTPPERLEELASAVRRTAMAISETMGYSAHLAALRSWGGETARG